MLESLDSIPIRRRRESFRQLPLCRIGEDLRHAKTNPIMCGLLLMLQMLLQHTSRTFLDLNLLIDPRLCLIMLINLDQRGQILIKFRVKILMLEEKVVQLFPIPMTYIELLPNLLSNTLVAIYPMKPLQPPYPKSYDTNVKCDYHDGVVGHSTETYLNLKFSPCSIQDDLLFKNKSLVQIIILCRGM